MCDDLIDRARAAIKYADRLGVPSPLLSDMADEIARLRAEVERLRELLRQERLDVLYRAYNCGIERDGKWMDGGMSDGEWLQQECGLPDVGWHDAATVRALILEAAKRFAEASHD